MHWRATEVGIYERKQESKGERKHTLDQESQEEKRMKEMENSN